MSVLRLKIKGWEDGEQVERRLEKPDRWQLHSADQVTLVIDDVEVTINQKVSPLAAERATQNQICSTVSLHTSGSPCSLVAEWAVSITHLAAAWQQRQLPHCARSHS
jgi:hypothetical protein